ncbi:MAG TPA: bifunctional adenosylcobinamide kinase/adenosylcobinamide-phosphate guanylyltransferase [Acidimicrobiales bacterium]|nr:bifunctional adenosylcobinamide kinase/adenosylcobinamide-phosphate guanylyltransferase [Acidimicrobiales bacterium]
MLTLILGGARSGKSAWAERRAATLPRPVTYLATALVGDDDMAARVVTHQLRRPPGWRTVEAGLDLAEAAAAIDGTLLLDSLGAWVARIPGFAAEGGALATVLQLRRGDSVVVSEEVGLGVHPASQAGRQFRDALGEVNQAVSAVADEVLLVVAGRALRLADLGDGS